MPRNSDFNRNHPERLPDELFVTNVPKEDDSREWGLIGWSTKRRGGVAYDNRDGKVVAKEVPVFIKREEVETAITKDEGWRDVLNLLSP